MSFKYYEFKYFVPALLLDRTIELLNAFYGGTDPFPEGWLSSVYFDSQDRKSINECKNGSLYKRKFRMRKYGQNDDSNCQLQIKEKELNAVWKHKLSVDTANDEKWPYHLIPMSTNIFTLSSQYHNLEPIVKTTYFRRRYRVFDYRITLDAKIHFKSCYGFRNQRFKAMFLPFGVLEIKTKQDNPKLPFFKLINLKQVSFSKLYLAVQCLENTEGFLNKYIAEAAD